MSVDLAHFKQLYLSTTREQLGVIAECVNQLMQDSKNMTAIETIHINIHAIGSKSLMMGHASTGLLCRKIEDKFRMIRDGKLLLSQSALMLIASCLQELSASIDSIEKAEKEIDLTQFINQVGGMQ